MPPPSYTNNAMHLRPKEKYEIFDTYVENEIAMFMTMEPGDGLVGSPNYDEHSKKEFLKSCETPIIIDEKDDEYTKSLKQQMIQTKIELRQRMADDEDFCQIMADTRNEMMRLGQVKQQIEGEMHDMLKSASTREDIETSIAAANKLLEEKGIAPIKVSPIFIRRLMHRKGIK